MAIYSQNCPIFRFPWKSIDFLETKKNLTFSSADRLALHLVLLLILQDCCSTLPDLPQRPFPVAIGIGQSAGRVPINQWKKYEN
jgi:hypothetical protein